jgi:hypothetical protein
MDDIFGRFRYGSWINPNETQKMVVGYLDTHDL